MKFSEEEKKVSNFTPTDYLPFGVHKVQLVQVEQGESDAGKEFIEFTVANEEGTEDTARCWFTGGASNISFNTIRQIVVHQAKTDETKEKARQAVDAVESTEDLVKILEDKCYGGELWFTKYYDATRTYEAKDGTMKRSINKNVLGYEPKLKPSLMPKEAPAGGDENFPGATPATASEQTGIPDSWA